MSMQPNNPLHGVKLEQIILELKEHYGWEYMGAQPAINPPILSSAISLPVRTPTTPDDFNALDVSTFFI